MNQKYAAIDCASPGAWPELPGYPGHPLHAVAVRLRFDQLVRRYGGTFDRLAGVYCFVRERRDRIGVLAVVLPVVAAVAHDAVAIGASAKSSTPGTLGDRSTTEAGGIRDAAEAVVTGSSHHPDLDVHPPVAANGCDHRAPLRTGENRQTPGTGARAIKRAGGESDPCEHATTKLAESTLPVALP